MPDDRIQELVKILVQRGVSEADAKSMAAPIARTSELSSAIRNTAKKIGADPLDLATVISYETGGRLDPNMMGGKGNNYMGLIQMGPEERRKYGVTKDMGITKYMDAAGQFLIDRGYKPGMGIMDLYSTVNAGAPGLYHLSDSPRGTPAHLKKTVATHVRDMMKGHRPKVEGWMGPSSDMDRPSGTPGNLKPISTKDIAPDLTKAQAFNASGRNIGAAGGDSGLVIKASMGDPQMPAATAQGSPQAAGLSATEQELKKNSTPEEWAEYQKTRDPTFQDVVAPNTGAAPAGATSPSPEATPAGNPMTEAMPVTPEGSPSQAAPVPAGLQVNATPVDARQYAPDDVMGQRYSMMQKYGLPPPPPAPPLQGAERFGPMIKPLMFQQFFGAGGGGGFGGMFKGFFGGGR